MTAVLLSAGKATRMGDHAPSGCKALVEVDGVTMLDRWREEFPDLVLVCRTEHVDALEPHLHGTLAICCDVTRGPAVALAVALPFLAAEPTTVIYADTIVDHVPRGDEWCAVAAAKGGRNWEVIEDGIAAYRSVEPDEVAVVSVGLYRFAEKWRLELALSHELVGSDGEVQMADVVNDLGLPFEPVTGWRDVGTAEALAA